VSYPARLESDRLVLERPRVEDGDAWAAILAAPEIDEEAWPAQLRTPEQIRATASTAVAHWDAHGFGPWSVRARGEDDVIGRAGLSMAIAAGRPEVEVGWWIAPRCWGGGLATEAARAAIQAGRVHLGLREVASWTTPANAASLAVMAKLGLTPEVEFLHAGLPHLMHRLRLD
jgi:RimJ/RimL family protein N-acetyltransferase